MQLPDTQAALLEAASTDEQPLTALAQAAELAEPTALGAAQTLADRGLLTVTEETRTEADLTDEGRTYLADGLPEVRLYEAARERDATESGVPLGEVLDEASLEGQAVDIALSNFARKDYGEVEAGLLHADPSATPEEDPEAAALAAIADGTAADETVRETLVRRGLVRIEEATTYHVALTEEGVTALMEGIEPADEGVDQLTTELLTSGEWRDTQFARYNVEADAPRVTAGRVHPLRQMVERVKEVLVGMGFAEMDGPHADAEFWINDCLFMPQDHPARTHWDQFALDVPPATGLPTDLLERIEAAHREGVGPDGEGYHSPWTEEMARTVDLRGHTTSLSMRYLSGLADGDIEPPARYFSVQKAYRNDTIDATHLLEFFQIEGWVMAEDLSVRDLMGTFREFYRQFGITDLQFKPTYNPYTEPSFELFGSHPTTGELIEIGNSGLFRPEVLEPLGVESDVMAWGLALERLMMLVTGAEDIRDVHGTLVDLDYLRTEEVLY
ncbi:MAG: phenylalanine--tRNA ligase subunit alpha [Halobacteriaceae archaeon]